MLINLHNYLLTNVWPCNIMPPLKNCRSVPLAPSPNTSLVPLQIVMCIKRFGVAGTKDNLKNYFELPIDPKFMGYLILYTYIYMCQKLPV